MKTLCQICILLCLVCLTNRNWAANPQPQADPPDSRSEIPFELSGGYLIVVQGRVGGIDNLRLVLDTGVTHSVLDSKLAARIGLSRRPARVLNFDKIVPAEWAEVPDLRFGPINVSHFSMMVGDLRYFQSFASHIDAVIGLDLLRLSSFSIDYNARKVSFGPVDTASGVPMDSDSVCLSVQLLVGYTPVRLLVDTGAQALVLYEDRIVNRLPQLRIKGEFEGVSMGGYVHAKRAILPKARLGTTDVERTVFLVKAPPNNVLPGIDGYIGTAALKAQRIDFNFETNTLAWKR